MEIEALKKIMGLIHLPCVVGFQHIAVFFMISSFSNSLYSIASLGAMRNYFIGEIRISNHCLLKDLYS